MKCAICNKNNAIQLFTSVAPCDQCSNKVGTEKIVLAHPNTGAPDGWLFAGWLNLIGFNDDRFWPKAELDRLAKTCTSLNGNARNIVEGVPCPTNSIVYYFKEPEKCH